MKKPIQFLPVRWIALAVCVLALASCSNTPENLKAIPADAKVVATVDPLSLALKGSMDGISDLNLFKKMEQEADKSNEKMSKLVKSLVENPTRTGIKFTTDVATYYVNDSDGADFICMSFELSDGSSFGSFLQEFMEAVENPIEIQQGEGYQYALADNDGIIGWDDKKAVLITAESHRGRDKVDVELKSQFSLAKEAQILANKTFMDFYKTKKDISVWLASSILTDSPEFRAMGSQMDMDFSGSAMAMHVDFQDGAISMTAGWIGDKAWEKQYAKYDIYNKEMNKAALALLPEETLFLGSMAIDFSGMLAIMEEQPALADMRGEFERNTQMSLDDVVNSLGGTIVLSLSDVKMEKRFVDYGFYSDTIESMVPVMGLAFDLNNKDILDKVTGMLPPQLLQNQGDYYSFDMGQYKGYMAYNDQLCLVTTDQATIDGFAGGGPSNSLSNSAQGQKAAKSPMYFYLDMNTNNYPPAVQGPMGAIVGYSAGGVMDAWNSMAKSMELHYIDQNTVELRFNTQNEDQNALRTIIETVDKNADKFPA